MKRKYLAAIVAALTLALPSCGGDDSPDKPAAAAGTSPAEQAEQPKRDSTSTTAAPDSSASTKAKNGDGGSSAADAQRAASQGESAAPSGGGSGSSEGKRKPKPKPKPQTPQEAIKNLTPSQKRHLDRDLYGQGKNTCYAYGAEELARSFNLPSSDPEILARLLARAYEKATPSLILPYQQGCLAGLRKFERNPPKN